MCKLPSPHLAKLLQQMNEKALSVSASERARLNELNKQAAREQLLRIQLVLAEKYAKSP